RGERQVNPSLLMLSLPFVPLRALRVFVAAVPNSEESSSRTASLLSPLCPFVFFVSFWQGFAAQKSPAGEPLPFFPLCAPSCSSCLCGSGSEQRRIQQANRFSSLLFVPLRVLRVFVAAVSGSDRENQRVAGKKGRSLLRRAGK